MPSWAFFRGKIVPFEEAKLSVATQAFNYGTAVFEGIRGFWNERKKKLFVFALKEHYLRFIDNWKILLINLPYTIEDLIRITLELLKREGLKQDLYIRPIAYKSSEKIKVTLFGIEDDLTIFVVPFGSYCRDEEDVRAIVSSWQRIDDNALPPRGKISGAYVNSALIKTEAQMAGFDESIVLNSDGHVAEASAANLFIVRDGKMFTPPVNANILEGITRKVVFKIAEEFGIGVEEREIDRTELYLADEIIICGTAYNVAAITLVDNRRIGEGKIGPICQKLRKRYFQIVRGEIEESDPWYHWLTEVEYITPLEQMVIEKAAR